VSGKESEAPGGPARGGRLGQAPHIKKPARTRRGLLPGSLAASQSVLPMFIGFGHACVSDEEDWGMAGR
jgi:hypothetical protein